jgi:hypothetical protein
MGGQRWGRCVMHLERWGRSHVKANDVLKGGRARQTENDRQVDIAVEGQQFCQL